jgi:hypothetical protein
MDEISLRELDQVNGGDMATFCWDVPGGSVCVNSKGTTTMQFGNVTIEVKQGGAITTTGTSTTTGPA